MKNAFSQKGEKKIIKRVLKKDKKALLQLYEENFEALYSFIFYRVGCDKHITEDITHDVFISMLDNLKNFDWQKGKLYSWLCGIARHKINDVFRYQKRHTSLSIVLSSIDAEIDTLLEVIDNQPLPDEVLENEELKACVASTMARLPAKYRQVLLNKYVNSFKVRKIAQDMELSEKAVESILTRARESFRKVFSLMLKDTVLIGSLGGEKI